MWSDWLVFCDCGFSLSALWCSLLAPTILTWVSLTLDVGYLFTAAPAKHSCRSWPWTWCIPSKLLLLTLNVGYFLCCAATAPCLYSIQIPLSNSCSLAHSLRDGWVTLVSTIRVTEFGPGLGMRHNTGQIEVNSETFVGMTWTEKTWSWLSGTHINRACLRIKLTCERRVSIQKERQPDGILRPRIQLCCSKMCPCISQKHEPTNNSRLLAQPLTAKSVVVQSVFRTIEGERHAQRVLSPHPALCTSPPYGYFWVISFHINQ